MPILIIFFIILSVTMLFSQDFDFPIFITDGTNSTTVIVGIDPNGSIGYDPGLDIFAPPPPPTGAFDARLRISNEDYITDIRNNSIAEKQFFLLYSPQTAGNIKLFWNSLIIDSLGSFQMIDKIDGSYFNLDMSTTDSLDIANFPILTNGLKILITPNPVVGIFYDFGDSDTSQDNYQLDQNFPNPFNLLTKIRYQLFFTGYVELFIYNCIGQRIKILVKKMQPAGIYHIQWDGKNGQGDVMPSGTYFCIFKLNSQMQIKKITLLK